MKINDSQASQPPTAQVASKFATCVSKLRAVFFRRANATAPSSLSLLQNTKSDARNVEWHNPHNLTDEQVGTKNGWRLLTKAELNSIYGAIGRLKMEANLDDGSRPKIEAWLTQGQWGMSYYSGNTAKFTYRTKAPLNHFVKEPFPPQHLRSAPHGTT